MADHVPMEFVINMPSDVEAGHYADFANIWHNRETFILDFISMTRPPEPVQDEAGQVVGAKTQASVVTRVRIPATQVWEVMKALETQLSAWEAERKAGGAG
ncbi:MAG TPA: DUF3467 domain-containing protein [Marmoricola sp.]|nr:DUF3467 domain-containing protein [Marmoricola sp.]